MTCHFVLLSLTLILHFRTAIAQDCPPANICYAIDESGSISSAEFTQQTDALVNITNRFNALAPGSTYAAAGFSRRATVVSQPTTDVPEFVQRLRSNTQTRGATSSGSGLNLCRDLLINQPEPRIIVLISDGSDNRNPRGTAVHQRIKDQGFSIATVGVGSGAQDDILQNVIASRPDLFTNVDDFDTFPVAIAGIVNSLCAAVTPSPSTSPRPSEMSTPSTSISVSPSVSATPSTSTSVTPSVSPTPSSSISVTPSVSVSPTPSVSMTPTPSASPGFNLCEPCKLNSQCKDGICFKWLCGSKYAQIKGGCLALGKKICSPCGYDYQCQSGKCWNWRCGSKWQQINSWCFWY